MNPMQSQPVSQAMQNPPSMQNQNQPMPHSSPGIPIQAVPVHSPAMALQMQTSSPPVPAMAPYAMMPGAMGNVLTTPPQSSASAAQVPMVGSNSASKLPLLTPFPANTTTATEAATRALVTPKLNQAASPLDGLKPDNSPLATPSSHAGGGSETPVALEVSLSTSSTSGNDNTLAFNSLLLLEVKLPSINVVPDTSVDKVPSIKKLLS